MAKEYRTVMYSTGVKGELIVHKLPFNAGDAIGMEKLQAYVKRGFRFRREEGRVGIGEAEVEVREGVEVRKPEEESEENNGEAETRKSFADGHGITFPNAEEAIKWLKQQGSALEVEEEAEEIGEAEIKHDSLIKCPECGRRCVSFWGLEAHMRKHKRERGEIPLVKRRRKEKQNGKRK